MRHAKEGTARRLHRLAIFVLVTAMHSALLPSFYAVGKIKVRSDLFDHMRDAPLPEPEPDDEMP
jgi:hypothetical protein